jgi:hypothetical protein
MGELSMKRSKPMARRWIRRREAPNVPPNDRPMAPLRALEKRPNYSGCTSGVPVEKDNAVRSEAYRRLVAAMPCKHCGRIGRSQAAHPPPQGKALKQDDRLVFALCADELMRAGCHKRFDQYELFPHDVALRWAARWAFETRAEILAAGDWPANLPMFDEATA